MYIQLVNTQYAHFSFDVEEKMHRLNYPLSGLPYIILLVHTEQYLNKQRSCEYLNKLPNKRSLKQNAEVLFWYDCYIAILWLINSSVAFVKPNFDPTSANFKANSLARRP